MKPLSKPFKLAALKGQFDAEHGCGLVHPGASMSWKQNAFPESNVQLTFHTDPLDCVSGNGWVTVEPDIDYHKDLAAHTILEVCRNVITGSLTEPAEVFVLRWIEQRRLGLPDFSPGYSLRQRKAITLFTLRQIPLWLRISMARPSGSNVLLVLPSRDGSRLSAGWLYPVCACSETSPKFPLSPSRSNLMTTKCPRKKC